MADVEQLSQILIKFAERASLTAGISMGVGVRGAPLRKPPKPPLVQVYEQCAGRLDEAERSELARLVEKMSEFLGP